MYHWGTAAFRFRIRIGSVDQDRIEQTEATVAAGTAYIITACSHPERLDITPAFGHPFILSDGRFIEQPTYS